METILNISCIILVLMVGVSFYKSNKYLKKERKEEIAFRAAVLQRMNKIGQYLVVLYWYETGKPSYILISADSGADALLKVEKDCLDAISYSSDPSTLNRFAIVNVQFLGE